MASASSSTDNTQKTTSTVPQSSTGASHVTSPVNGSQSGSSVYPIVPTPLEDPSRQPTALVFPSGIAFDYENFPKLVSICWPIITDQSGRSVLAKDGPTRALPRGINFGNDADKATTSINQEAVESATYFRWDRPHTAAKDPIARTPGIKAPICASHNTCELQTETNMNNTGGCVSSRSVHQYIPPLVQPCACPIHRHSMFKRPRLQHVEISGQVLLNGKKGIFDNSDATILRILEHTGHPKTQPNQMSSLPEDFAGSADKEKEGFPVFGQVLISSDRHDADSNKVTIRKILERKPVCTRTKPMHVSSSLPENTIQGTLVSEGTSCPEDQEKPVPCSSNVPNDQSSQQRLQGKNTHWVPDNISTGTSRDDILLSSTEGEQTPKDIKEGEPPTAEISCLVSSSKEAKDVTPMIVIEDDGSETTSRKNAESSAESYGFISRPSQSGSQSVSHPSSGSHRFKAESEHQSTGSTSLNLETGNKQENVRDLITRIRYIKSRLNRAESEYRKKQMLKAILGLQKRVKALTKGMRKEKVDIAKEQAKTSDISHDGVKTISCQELLKVNQYAVSDLQATDTSEGQAGRVVKDENDLGGVDTQGDALLLYDTQLSTNVSKDATRQKRQNHQDCEKLTSPSVIKVTPHNDVEVRETKEMNLLKTSANSNNRRQERGSLSLLNPDGVLKDLVVSLPAGIRLDSPPGTCGKRSFPSSVGENELQGNHDTTYKKMKRLSLSDQDVKDQIATGSSSFQDFTHNAQSVAQDGAKENLVPKDDGVKHNEADVLENQMSLLPVEAEMDKNGTVSCSLPEVTQDVPSVTQDGALESLLVPNEKNQVKDSVNPGETNVSEKDRTGTACYNFQDVTYVAQSVKQNGFSGTSEPNEENKDENSIRPCATNMAQEKTSDFPMDDEMKRTVQVRLGFEEAKQHSQSITQECESGTSVTNVGNKEDSCLTYDEPNVLRNELLDYEESNEESISSERGRTITDAGQKISLPPFEGNEDKTSVNIEERGTSNTLLVNGMLDEGGEGEYSQTFHDIEKDCSVIVNGTNSVDDSTSPTRSENSMAVEDVEMEDDQPGFTQDLPDHETCTQDIDWPSDSAIPLEDNENDQELFRLSLGTVLEEEGAERLTTSPLHRLSGSEEDVDLTRSLQIREARILNLTEKRDRLFNLVGLKKNRL